MILDATLILSHERQVLEIIWNTYIETVSKAMKPETEAKKEIRLFGPGAELDSLGLVTLLLDVEQQVNDQLGVSISLMDERAMSQNKSPFRTIGTLADYIQVLLDETHE